MNKYGINKNVRNLRTGVNFIRNVAAPKIGKSPPTQSSKFISNPSHYLSNTSNLIIVLVRKDN